MDKSFETHLPLESATLSNHLSKTEDKTQWNLLSWTLQTSDHTPGKLRNFPVWTRWPLWSLLTWYSIIMKFQLKKKKKPHHLLEPSINHSETVLVSVSQWKKRNLGDGKRITFSFSSVGSGDFPEFGSYHQLLNVCAESQAVASSHFAQSSSYKPQTPTNEVHLSYDDFSVTTSIT